MDLEKQLAELSFQITLARNNNLTNDTIYECYGENYFELVETIEGKRLDEFAIADINKYPYLNFLKEIKNQSILEC